MNLQTLFMFVLSTIGMCHIIVDGSIMESFRNQLKDFCNKIGRPNLGSVVDCYLCCGTWCGFFMGMVWVSINPFQVLACGCAGGFLSNLAAVVLNWIESLTYVNLPNEKS